MKFRILVTQFVLLLILAAIPALLVFLYLGSTPSRGPAAAAAFAIALLVAAIGAAGKVYFQRFTDRPILRIEHVDFKSERQPFKLDDELWWFVTHSGFNGFIENEKDLQRALLKNEFQHYHLQPMEEAASAATSTYAGTARWTRSLLARLKAFAETPDEGERTRLLQGLSPHIVRFEDHYREAGKGSIYQDLRTKPQDAAAFLESEIEGLLTRHERELAHFQDIKAWISNLLPQGPNRSQTIDHAKQVVPRIRMAIGLMNLGNTAALIRGNVDLVFEGKHIPFRTSSSYQGTLDYGLVDARGVLPFWLEIDKPGCAFQDQKLLYEALTAPGARHFCTVRLSLPDGGYIERTRVQLIDNGELRI